MILILTGLESALITNGAPKVLSRSCLSKGGTHPRQQGVWPTSLSLEQRKTLRALYFHSFSSLLCLHNPPSSPACSQHCEACMGTTQPPFISVIHQQKPNSWHGGFANPPFQLARLASFRLAHPLETLLPALPMGCGGMYFGKALCHVVRNCSVCHFFTGLI